MNKIFRIQIPLTPNTKANYVIGLLLPWSTWYSLRSKATFISRAFFFGCCKGLVFYIIKKLYHIFEYHYDYYFDCYLSIILCHHLPSIFFMNFYFIWGIFHINFLLYIYIYIYYTLASINLHLLTLFIFWDTWHKIWVYLKLKAV